VALKPGRVVRPSGARYSPSQVIRALLQRPGVLSRINTARVRSRFVNGIDWLIRDPKSVVGRTPYAQILRDDKLVVRRYKPPKGGPRFGTPVLLVPPLMVKPFIFDLHPGRSLVEHLRCAGYSVYLVDFGEPDSADAYVTLDHYVMDWMPAACEAVKRDAKSEDLTLYGYCMGGLFALSHTAANNDTSVRNLVTIAAPVDTQKMGMFAWLAKHGSGQIDFMASRIGNLPGRVSSTAFKMLAPVKQLTRYADLFMNMYDQEYVNGFDAMRQWTGQFIDYPQGAFQQFLKDFMAENKLYEGKMRFRGQDADLATIGAAMLAFAGETDQVVPEAAARGAMQAVGSKDKTFHLVAGGHMGVFAGSRAPERVWTVASEWLAERSRPLKAS
jgi:polyhydroxyalkanoate synthase